MPVVPHIQGMAWALPGSYLANAAMMSGSRLLKFFSLALSIGRNRPAASWRTKNGEAVGTTTS